MENVEPRRLMSGVSTAAAKMAINDAIARVTNRNLYSDYDLNVTRQWAVRTSPTTNLTALATKLGASKVEPSGILADVFIASFSRAKLDRLGGDAVAQKVSSIVGEDASWPIVARQQSKRGIPDDTLFGNQWHLRNTGQSGGTAGYDTNITGVWDTYTGAGVQIGIVDDGLDYNHVDLSPNYRSDLSYDYWTGDNNPLPGAGDDHGTAVAGVAAARGNNGIGVSGSAPQAQLAGLRTIVGATTDTQEANSMSHQRNVIDIYSNSWGPFDNGSIVEAPGPLTLAAFVQDVTIGRGGLGNIITWAGGNGLDSGDDSNFDGYANSRYVVAVGAIDHDGIQSWYSEPGANLLVAAYSNGDVSGITTTDRVGTNGYSTTDYTNDFGGTSSATPLVSGVVALMLQANPNLTWRDVHAILAKSAEKVDPSDTDWINNGAGLHVNHKYGFGGIDAQAAVNLALTWTNLAPEVSATSGTLTVNAAIPNNNATGISRTFTVADAIKLETIEVVFSANHFARGEMKVVLTSPSGTQSVLASERPDTNANLTNWTFSSRRHLDEDARGTWTLRVIDDSGTATGTWGNWKLNLYGTAIATTPTVNGTVYTDANGNGARDGTDAGLAGATVWVDLDLDTVLDAGEPSVVTTANGNYTFSNLALGTNTVRIVAPAGKYVTDGASGKSFTLTAGANTANNVLFGTTAPATSGIVFNDTDADGVFDAGETGRSGVTVYADLDNDTTFDAGEPSAITDASGAYRVENLPVGSASSIRVVAPAGNRLTGPAVAGFNVTPTLAALVPAGQNVGATTTILLAGRAFDDQNFDNAFTPGEPGLPGARVFLDANNNGIYDNTTYDVAQNTALTLPDNTTRTSTLVVSGTGATVNALSVRVNITHSWVGDLSVTLISPAGTRITLTDGNGGERNGFNVTFNTTATTSPASWSGTDGAAITGTYRPIGNLASLNGQSLDGTWSLEIIDSFSGDTGTLTSWSLFGSSVETSRLTAADGTYAFDALPATTYRVRQVAPAAPYQLAAVSASGNTVVAASGTTHPNLNFVNINTTAPTFNTGAYERDAATPRITLIFTSPVLIDPSDLVLQTQDGLTTIPSTDLAVAYDGGTNTATVSYIAHPSGILPNAKYRLTVTTGVTSPGGAPLAASGEVLFNVLAGDADNSGTVDFNDLLTLAQNYNQSPKVFSEGNFDYSANGLVDFNDLLTLAQNYNTSLLSMSAASAFAGPASLKGPASRTRQTPTELVLV
jgi:subtilisin-like proprotein convertase family protein